MRLSTSTCIYFNRPDGSKKAIVDSVRACAEAGYRVMDMNFHDASVFKTPFCYDGWEDWVYQIRDVASDVGITFSQSHSHFYNYTEDGSDNDYLEMLVRRGILASEMLGIPWTVIHAATDFNSPWMVKSSKKKAIDYFSRLLEFAAEHHVGLAIENLWELNISPKRRYTSNVEELMDLVSSLDFPNVGICWDVEHSAQMGQDLRAAFKIVEEKLRCTHISDYVDKKHDHILPFAGISDWEEVIDAFASIRYEGDFTYEAHRATMMLPEALVSSMLRYSYDVGTYLVNEIERRKKK